GTLFVAVLFATSICVSLTSVVLRRIYRLPGPFGAFREIRPPDALVWTVIALALAYLAYRQWPAPALLAIVGNAGVALAAIYALNGFAITVYAANLFPRFFAVILVVAAVMVLIYAPFFVLIGFFDTWGDFRNRMRTAKAAVKPPEE
ncbi:MAG: YybS family protein, partial [Candidatus Hydrogenedentes bacterium]|nr:YybS family protein [Candidatus Hydrogenedentota bacterium]